MRTIIYCDVTFTKAITIESDKPIDQGKVEEVAQGEIDKFAEFIINTNPCMYNGWQWSEENIEKQEFN